jgi:hypothetical protein
VLRTILFSHVSTLLLLTRQYFASGPLFFISLNINGQVLVAISIFSGFFSLNLAFSFSHFLGCRPPLSGFRNGPSIPF